MGVLAGARDWDADAREQAWREARAQAHRDPEAAAMLMTQLDAAERAQEQGRVSSVLRRGEPYDPSRFYAQLMHYYNGLTWQSIDALHFVSCFALHREAVLMSEDEQEQSERQQRGGARVVESDDLARTIPAMHVYDGQTVPKSPTSWPGS